MNKFVYALILFFLTFAVKATEEIPPAFLGKWKSDSALTLASVKKSTIIKDSDIELFNEDVFGEQFFEFRDKNYTTYFLGDNPPHNFIKYNITEVGENHFVLINKSQKLNLTVKQIWYIEGNHIYTYIKEYGFKEYFRRVE